MFDVITYHGKVETVIQMEILLRILSPLVAKVAKRILSNCWKTLKLKSLQRRVKAQA